jgi:hypothetical protein
MLEMDCPYCGKHLQIPPQFAGQQGKCTHCGMAIIAPGGEDVPPPQGYTGPTDLSSLRQTEPPPDVQPVKKVTAKRIFACGCLLPFSLMVVLAAISTPSKDSSSSTSPVAPQASVAPSSEVESGALAKQPERAAFIEKLIKLNILTRVEQPGPLPQAYVTNVFLAFSEKMQCEYLNPVLAYYFLKDSSAKPLILLDAKTGERLGSFDGVKIQWQKPPPAAAVPPAPPVPAQQFAPRQAPVASSVYVVAKGDVYHSSANCSTLSRSSPSRVSLAQAQQMGRRRCQRCY